jgi:pantoate--beta-alanine ligase
VPTMGALHAGHEALFAAARPECDLLVASIFVNPAQFEDGADLARYPRDLERDLAVAEASDVDVVFAPSADELYPPGFATWVVPEGVALGLEAEHRVGHFRGVATVCLKLFTIVRPDLAWFGRKDAQQVAVVKQLVRDLNLELEIRVVPTVRDADGLALSSRNARLSRDERERALALPGALTIGAEAHRGGGDAVAATRAALNGLVPDYVELLDLDGVTILASAAHVGATRLIDNVILEGELT